MKPGPPQPVLALLPCLLALVLALGLAPTAWAKRQALQFAPGASSAQVSGAVVRGERDTYLLVARAGQSMRVSISSLEDNAVVVLRLPGQEERYLPGAGDGDDATSWQGRLPVSGTYQLVVGPTRGNTQYRLRVEITN